MVQEYHVKRKLQEQSGSYFVTLPKIWVEAMALKEGDIMSVRFNGIVKVEPSRKQESTGNATKKDQQKVTLS